LKIFFKPKNILRLHPIYKIFHSISLLIIYNLMKSFRMWIESREQNIRDTILTLLGLDEDGLETPLESLKPENIISKLEPLGMWNNLPADKQNTIKAMIKNQLGTIGELIDKITSLGPNNLESPGVMPPQEDF
jgi:hypothetical protein